MEKLKDFFYDKNDLVVALIIIAIAGLLIAWRVNVIMDYPKIMAAQIEEEQNELPDGSDPSEPGDQPAGTGTGTGTDADDPSGTDGSAGSSGNGSTDSGTVNQPDGSNAGQSGNGTGQSGNNTGSSGSSNAGNSGNSGNAGSAAASRTITIPSGASGSKIAQILVDAGLISSSAAFNEAVMAAGADTKLKAGTFTIPQGASAAEIVNIITR